MPVMPKFVAPAADADAEKVVKESNEARFARLAASITGFSCESSHPQGGKGAQNLFLRIKSGDEEIINLNLGVPDADPMAHNTREAAICRLMANALLANAEACDAVNEQIRAHLTAQAVAKVAKIKAKLEQATTPAARRDVIKSFGLHGPEFESIPNGAKLDKAIEEMLEKMVTFE